MRDDVTVLLLGPVRLATPAGPVAVRDGDQRTVLARLACTPGELVRVHELIDALWGESFPITAVKTLHSHVARLRRELRATGLDGLISTDGSGYCLQVPPACVDSIRFESLARMGRRHLNAGEFAQVVRTLNDATRLWRGKPLADCRRTPWAQREATRLSEIMASVRDTLGKHIEAPVIDTETPRFVSRDTDVEEVTWLLANGRMATLTGVGGVGKSTLATQVAHCNQSSYPDGVWFVELAALHDFGLLAHTVADALGLHDQSGRPMTTVLADHFKSQIALLVLDNCEQVGAACASFVDTLLHAAPDLRILVTSKVPLHIEAEQIYDVRPLPVPDPDQEQSGAVTLFVQRAAEALPDGFELTEENQAEVMSLCCRLEGVPLALELAAAQLRRLPLSELVAQLDSMIRIKPAVRAIVDFSYDLCSPAERLLWRRMSVFEGSYDLVAVENVCAGYNDIPLDTVLDVLDGLVSKSVLTKLDERGPARYRLPETLRQYGREQLRQAGEQPLVRRRHRNWYLTVAEQREQHWFGPAQHDMSIRTRLDHANLRAALEFCLSEPGEEAAGLRLAGALWFHWIGSGLLAEAQHWLDWALSATRQSTIDRWKALWVNGYVTALQGKIEASRQLLAQIDADADDASRTHATYVLGLTALLDNDRTSAAALLERAALQFQDIGELDATAIMARVAWALIAAQPQAERLCQEAQDACEANGEKWSLAYVLIARGVIAARKGEPAAAAALARESLRLKESCHDLLAVAAAIGLLAVTTADHARTAALLGIARRIRLHIGPDGPPAVDAAQVHCAEQARKALGDAKFDAAFVQGARMSLSAAVDFALS